MAQAPSDWTYIVDNEEEDNENDIERSLTNPAGSRTAVAAESDTWGVMPVLPLTTLETVGDGELTVDECRAKIQSLFGDDFWYDVRQSDVIISTSTEDGQTLHKYTAVWTATIRKGPKIWRIEERAIATNFIQMVAEDTAISTARRKLYNSFLRSAMLEVPFSDVSDVMPIEQWFEEKRQEQMRIEALGRVIPVVQLPMDVHTLNQLLWRKMFGDENTKPREIFLSLSAPSIQNIYELKNSAQIIKAIGTKVSRLTGEQIGYLKQVLNDLDKKGAGMPEQRRFMARIGFTENEVPKSEMDYSLLWIFSSVVRKMEYHQFREEYPRLFPAITETGYLQLRVAFNLVAYSVTNKDLKRIWRQVAGRVDWRANPGAQMDILLEWASGMNRIEAEGAANYILPDRGMLLNERNPPRINNPDYKPKKSKLIKESDRISKSLALPPPGTKLKREKKKKQAEPKAAKMLAAMSPQQVEALQAAFLQSLNLSATAPAPVIGEPTLQQEGRPAESDTETTDDQVHTETE